MNQSRFVDCILYGKYYYPASSHYNNDSIIQCDRCFRSNLHSCIGFENLDICLSCAQITESHMKPIDRAMID